ncbi:MAG: hypothetical protein CMH54_14090 [Myxococcales bacterium]|nr:hypothetical protein [Myxococcales bacterium]
MPLLLDADIQPIHWAIAGAAMGVFVVSLQFLANRSFGISTGFETLCSLFSRQPYFQRERLKRRWRLPFFLGLILGGVLSAVMAGGIETSWALGRFDALIDQGRGFKAVWMLIGGFLVGFGTRLAGGCTSGHGIFGLANFEKASLVTVLCFMAAGVASTQLIYRVFAG